MTVPTVKYPPAAGKRRVEVSLGTPVADSPPLADAPTIEVNMVCDLSARHHPRRVRARPGATSLSLNPNLTVRANRMNLIVKKVTSWAAIIAVPTAITGFYGQNGPYPGSGSQWGVLTSVALIAGLSALLYLTFKRKDWL